MALHTQTATGFMMDKRSFRELGYRLGCALFTSHHRLGRKGSYTDLIRLNVSPYFVDVMPEVQF